MIVTFIPLYNAVNIFWRFTGPLYIPVCTDIYQEYCGFNV
jgi:hypothetical protein